MSLWYDSTWDRTPVSRAILTELTKINRNFHEWIILYKYQLGSYLTTTKITAAATTTTTIITTLAVTQTLVKSLLAKAGVKNSQGIFLKVIIIIIIIIIIISARRPDLIIINKEKRGFAKLWTL